jgi:MoxR-vWA-beta-propeller ternary system domain bpX2
MFLLEIDIQHKDFLGSIRHWDNLKVGFDEKSIWVKDFTNEQLYSSELQQIPFKEIYEVKDNLLFVKGSLLPTKKMRSGLLWSPILRALPVILPSLNHNYFGIDDKVTISIQPSQQEKEAYALLTDYATAKQYIESAPSVRLLPLQWIIIGTKILLIGQPLLPIKGQTYWKNNHFLMPSGYDFEFHILSETIQQKMNSSQNNYILWEEDGRYITITKSDIQSLSISSFRLTFSKV